MSKAKERPGEKIGGGYFIFHRVDGEHGRIVRGRIFPSVNSVPFEHANCFLAVQEAKRLAASQPGKEFCVFVQVASYKMEEKKMEGVK